MCCSIYVGLECFEVNPFGSCTAIMEFDTNSDSGLTIESVIETISNQV